MTITQSQPAAPSPSDGHDARPLWRRPPVSTILLIWAGYTAALVVFALVVPARLMGAPASSTMQEIETTFTSFTLMSAPVAAMVLAICTYSLVVWRHRGTEPPPPTDDPVRGNTRVETIWVLASAVLCLVLLIWGLVVITPTPASAERSGSPLVVNVTGQQWTWTFDYPDGHEVTDTPYLPVGQEVLFRVTSKDVVHSFWIVEMGIKIDANPGEITSSSVIPLKTGVFTIRCAELCGLYHAYMQTTVHVVSRSDYADWLASTQKAAS
ncbi:MAG: cytochrome c oxidase subunit II [Actinomycetota bacterium]|nr:cytochrome c oxidase subunit II [Actinomycetota bacterium]